MKKLMSILLAVLLMCGLAACGGGDTSSSAPVASMPASSSSQEPPVVSIPAPSSSQEPLEQAFLTGLPKGEDYPEGQRMVAVMLNNAPAGRPHRGISEAQILVEIGVEYDITRFMALYEDYTKMPVVGPIRSARDQFFQIILPFRSFYIHDGQSGPTKTMFEQYEYADYDMATGKYGVSASENSLAWRDNRGGGFATEFTEYASGERMVNVVANHELDTYRSYSPMFNFVPYTEPPRVPEGGVAEEVTVVHTPRYYMSYFDYDNNTGRYMMSMYSERDGGLTPTIDENNNQQLGFENVLVLFATRTHYPNSVLPKWEYNYGGYGYLMTQGHYELITWKKDTPYNAIELFDEAGNPLYINTGQTYLSMVRAELRGDFEESLASGNAQQVATQGGVNTDRPQDE